MPREKDKTPGKPTPHRAYRSNDTTAATPQRHHLVQVVLDANMAWQHDGMRAVMSDLDIQYEDLGPGQFVVFLNRHRTKAKIYVDGIIAYLRTEDGSQITFEMLSRIPRAFQAHGNIAALEPLRLAIDTGIEVAAQPVSPRRNDTIIVRRQGSRPLSR